MSGRVLVGLDFGQPLEGIGGPVERTQQEVVVTVSGLFLPKLVLLVDDHLFFLIELYLTPHVPSAIMI